MTIADIVLNEADVKAGVLLAKTNAISTEGVTLNETSTVCMNHYMLLTKTDVFSIKIVALDEVNVIDCVWLVKIDINNIENVALNAADVMEAIPIDDFIRHHGGRGLLTKEAVNITEIKQVKEDVMRVEVNIMDLISSNDSISVKFLDVMLTSLTLCRRRRALGTIFSTLQS